MKRILSLAVMLLLIPAVGAQERLEFHRMVAHWSDYGDPEYLNFIREARPEIAQVGFYGAHFYSIAHTPAYKGYPAHFPVQGLDECGAWFERLNRDLHKEKVKVVGHFNVEFLVGDPDSPMGPRGFFKFYRDLWDEKAFGKRPVEDPIQLLERDIDGKPIQNNSYSIGGMKEYWGCLNNPHWRAVLKAWVKAGIDRGVDGYISNYFYRHNCHCEHCQKNFRAYLNGRFTDNDLAEKFDIKDLKSHKFSEIVFWHNPKESTPLKREMLRFSQISIKDAYDDVFVKHGRSLKPGLILAQWNHLGNFSQINGDERCMLPKELWGKDEDYAWYSTGGAAFYTDLENKFLGEGTLQGRFIRGAFDNKPYTLGKYESTRTRVAIAEMAANGGAAMGFYTRFKDPLARQEIVRYYNFLEKHADLYRGQKSHAEVALLFPRSKVHEGDVEPVETFRKYGKELLDQHVLFDVVPDDLMTDAVAKRYRQVVNTKDTLSVPKGISQVNGPYFVRVSANRTKAGDLAVHLVNYNRTEPAKAKSAGKGIVDENPIAAENVALDLVVPPDMKVSRVEFLTPETPEPRAVPFEVVDGRLRLTAPSFLVYGVLRIRP